MDAVIPAPYCHTVHPLLGPIEDVVERLEHALKERGFVILNRICLHDALGQSHYGSEPPCVIVSTCHPELVTRALRAERNSVVILPMNVAVRQEESGSISVIFEAPEALTTLLHGPVFADVSRVLSENMRELISALYSQSCKEASRCQSLATSRCHSPTALGPDTTTATTASTSTTTTIPATTSSPATIHPLAQHQDSATLSQAKESTMTNDTRDSVPSGH